MANVIHFYRTIWLSDVHLGSKDCKAQFLTNFLKSVQCEKLVLAGDIIDFWALKRQPYWPETHMALVQLLLEMARKGTRIIYVPGNHDASIRKLGQPELNLAEIHHQYLHETCTGKKVLVMHGDEFDGMVCYSRFYSIVGDISYDLLMFLNRYMYRFRKLMGYKYWSLSGYIKQRIPKAAEAIGRFRQAAFTYAERKQVDMLVCGHIHHPEMVQSGGITYINLGDWVENCTCLVEELDGSIHLLRSTDASHGPEKLVEEPIVGAA